MTQPVPIHPNLFTWPSLCPQLLGSRCRTCGETAFPAQSSCRACSGTDTEVIGLGARGTLWTWTVQRFKPKPPYRGGSDTSTFQPYGVGYIELPGGVRVEAPLLDTESLRIGMPMELV